MKTNKIVSIAPMKSVKNDHNILMNDNTEISRIYDGTMINVFYHNDDWVLSTRSFMVLIIIGIRILRNLLKSKF